MDVSTASTRFLASAGIADATRRAYAADIRGFVDWYGDGDVGDIDVRVLADWVAALRSRRAGGKLAPATISRKLAAVRALLRFTLGPGHVPDTPFRPRRGRHLPDAPKA